jgi:hypothetical protein
MTQSCRNPLLRSWGVYSYGCDCATAITQTMDEIDGAGSTPAKGRLSFPRPPDSGYVK